MLCDMTSSLQQHQNVKVLMIEKFSSKKEGSVSCEEACLVIEGPIINDDPTRYMPQVPSCDACCHKWAL